MTYHGKSREELIAEIERLKALDAATEDRLKTLEVKLDLLLSMLRLQGKEPNP